MYRGKTKVVVAFVLALGLILSSFSLGFAAGPNAPKVPEPPAVGNPHGNYVALGDSLAAGMTPEDGFGPSYADMLAVKLTDGNSTYSNFGIPGLTAEDLNNILRNPQPTAKFNFMCLQLKELSVTDTAVLVMKITGIDSPTNTAVSSYVGRLKSSESAVVVTALNELAALQRPFMINAISNAAIITLDIGGNDALLYKLTPDAITVTASAMLNAIPINIFAILGSITSINKTGAKIYVMGYPYNDPLTQTLNDAIESACSLYTNNTKFVPTAFAFVSNNPKFIPAGEVHPTILGYKKLANILWSKMEKGQK